MDEREVRARLNDAASGFHFQLEGSERVVRRTRARIVRTQVVAATLVVGAIVAVTTVLTGLESRITPRPEKPVGPGPTEVHPIIGIDQDFVDNINGCALLPVKRQEVESALGFRSEAPTPWNPPGFREYSQAQVEQMGGVVSGCKYGSIGSNSPGTGHLVISAYLADEPPKRLGRSQSVSDIGDEERSRVMATETHIFLDRKEPRRPLRFEAVS